VEAIFASHVTPARKRKDGTRGKKGTPQAKPKECPEGRGTTKATRLSIRLQEQNAAADKRKDPKHHGDADQKRGGKSVQKLVGGRQASCQGSRPSGSHGKKTGKSKKSRYVP